MICLYRVFTQVLKYFDTFHLKMVRHYKRRSSWKPIDPSVLSGASNDVLTECQSTGFVAEKYAIPRSALRGYIGKAKRYPDSIVQPSWKGSAVFNNKQEPSLIQYIPDASVIFYVLEPKNLKTLTYQCSVKYNIEALKSWLISKMADKDWLIGILTVKKINDVVLPQGAKKVSDITSAQQRELVMVFATVNALGNHVTAKFVNIRISIVTKIDILLSVICMDDYNIYQIGDFVWVSFVRKNQDYVYEKRRHECTQNMLRYLRRQNKANKK